MTEITDINEIKKIELGILLEIHTFCKENNIRYFLTFGTLIGAIRHNGFIPWDDDIDIFIPQADYEKFITTFSSPNYKCYSMENNKKYPFTYAKVVDCRTLKKEPIHLSKKISLGIDVDVFPLNLYYDVNYEKKIEKRWKRYKKLWYLSISNFKSSTVFTTIFSFLFKALLRPFNRTISRKISRLTNCPRKGRKPIGYITAFCTSEKIRTYKLDWFENPLLHKFEDFEFFIPTGYDELLKSIYGDYMKLPPVEKQVSYHKNNCYYVGDKWFRSDYE